MRHCLEKEATSFRDCLLKQRRLECRAGSNGSGQDEAIEACQSHSVINHKTGMKCSLEATPRCSRNGRQDAGSGASEATQPESPNTSPSSCEAMGGGSGSSLADQLRASRQGREVNGAPGASCDMSPGQ